MSTILSNPKLPGASFRHERCVRATAFVIAPLLGGSVIQTSNSRSRL